jgi:hypothetical protein
MASERNHGYSEKEQAGTAVTRVDVHFLIFALGELGSMAIGCRLSAFGKTVWPAADSR